MPTSGYATVTVAREQLMLIGSPGGSVYRHMVLLLMRADAIAKRKLNGEMVGKRTGNLLSSQATPTVVRHGGFLVGTLENKANYAYYVHAGTRPHDIRPTHKSFLRFTPAGASGPVFTKLVHHPGTKGRPWLTEAVHEALTRL